MRRSHKVKLALARRIKGWEDLDGRLEGMIGTTTKLVRWSETRAAFHKPGSRNRKKGSGRARSTR